jgi:uncharacterized membrane protein
LGIATETEGTSASLRAPSPITVHSRPRSGSDRKPLVLVWLATVAYASIGAYFAVRRHDAFRSGFDLANFDQALWLLARGDEPFITQHGRHLLGDHFDPGLLLLVPMYVLHGGPHALLVLQSITIALVAPLLYVLARTRGATAWLAVLPAVLWLAAPTTLAQNMDDVHHIALIAPVIVGSIVFLERNRLVAFAVLALVACSFKEDVPLLFVMLGVIVLLEGRRRLGVAIATGGAAVFAFAVTIFMPHYSDSLDWFAKRFAGNRGDSLSEVFVWIIAHPLATVGHVVTFHNLALVAVLVFSTGGLCLLAPRWMLLAVPALAQNLLSAYPQQQWVHLHYQFPVLLGLAIAGAVGVSTVPRFRYATNRRLLAVWVGVAIGAFPIGVVNAHSLGVWDEVSVSIGGGPQARREAVALIPDDASVAATQELLPHLSRRHDLYALPLPFLAADYGGDYTEVDLQERARQVQYVVMDITERPNVLPTMPRVLPGLLVKMGFHRIATRGSIYVFARETAG